MPRNTTPPIGILGTGEYAQALAKRLLLSGYTVICGSRAPKNRNLALVHDSLAKVKVVTIPQCIKQVNIVIVCLHADDHPSLEQHASSLAGKTVVDASNPTSINKDPSNAEQLADLLPESHTIKAFNTVSAYTMESAASGESRIVYVCGNDLESKTAVIELARNIGFNAVDSGSLQQAKHLENLPLELFTEWQAPFKITIILLTIWLVYGNARYLFLKNDPYSFQRIASNITNKAFACTALTLLAITYLPGNLASIAQIINGTKHKRFPDWLDAWLKMRKQLGVFALLFTSLHMVLSISLMSPAYFKPWYLSDKTSASEGGAADIASRMNWLGETVLLLGVLAVVLMVILGLTSVPAVGNLLNWREWKLVHSYLGSLCLLLATLHLTVIALPDWLGEPPYMAVQRLTLLSSLCPSLVLGLKLVLSIPVISNYVWKIRRGWERGVSYENESKRK